MVHSAGGAEEGAMARPGSMPVLARLFAGPMQSFAFTALPDQKIQPHASWPPGEARGIVLPRKSWLDLAAKALFGC